MKVTIEKRNFAVSVALIQRVFRSWRLRGRWLSLVKLAVATRKQDLVVSSFATRNQERRAATLIQAVWRSYVVRKKMEFEPKITFRVFRASILQFYWSNLMLSLFDRFIY